MKLKLLVNSFKFNGVEFELDVDSDEIFNALVKKYSTYEILEKILEQSAGIDDVVDAARDFVEEYE